MEPLPATEFNQAELAALLHFYAEAGVDTLIEDGPIDRIREFAESKKARPVEAPSAAAPERRESRPPAPTLERKDRPQQTVVIPDADAVGAAVKAAESAKTVAELAEVVATFSGCNLKNSARNVAFLRGNPAARILVAGGLAGAEDDRDGRPFSGAPGMLLSKMLDSIGLGEEDVLIFNLIPWRPPGDRAPYAQELEICRPFGNRLIEIVKPDAMLIFGNYPARALLRSTATIHSLRGKWHEIACGSQKIPAVTTFHPQELIATPLNKRLAWQDLLLFSTLLTH